MTTKEQQAMPNKRSGVSRRSPGVKLGSISGMEIRLDWSLTLIFLLITVSLATGLFPAWHPNWQTALRWGVALGAATLFLFSIFLHELAHAVVGRWRGAQVRSLTLFVFGGLAQFEGEFKRPRDEFLSAIAGPFVSIVIGIGATSAGLALIPRAVFEGAGGQAEFSQLFAAAGPVATLLLWLGPINLVLAIFNLVPGFPLDGGRVLRSLIWSITGNQAKATHWAAGVGRGFGWLLMMTGVAMTLGFRVPFFGTGVVSGIWLLLIGWFLAAAARSSQQHVLIQKALSDVPVEDLMQKPALTVDAELDVATLVREYILPHSQPMFPVQDGDRMIGLVGFNQIGDTPRGQWATLKVREVMIPLASLHQLSPEEPANTAYDTLLRDQVEQLPVVQDGQVRGVLRLADLMRWVTLNQAGFAHKH